VAGDVDRDRNIEALLRRTLRDGDAGPAVGPGPCLEPEQFAAWVDGSLSADDARAVELHLSNCARCQAMAAAFAAADAEPRPETAEVPARVSANVVPITAKRPIRWMLPIVAGTIAATLVVWFGTRNNQPQPEAEIAQTRNSAEQLNVTPSPTAPADAAAKPQAQLAEKRDARADKAAPSPSQSRGGVSPAELQKERRTEPAPRPATPPPPAPPPPPPARLPAPAAAPVPPPANPTFRSTTIDPQTGAGTRPAAAATGTVSGLPASSVNITLDGVSAARVVEGKAVAEFSSPLPMMMQQQNAAVGDARAAGGRGGGAAAGRGGAGGGGAAIRTTTAEARGSIEGTARDLGGGALPGANILAKDLSSGVTSSAVTDNAGNFRLSSLAPGRYSVTASLTGFVQQVVDDVIVESGRASRVNLPLAVGAISERVTVAGASAGVAGGVAKAEQSADALTTSWRIFERNVVLRSRDAGRSWQQTRVDHELPIITTGVAPSATVCWLVGRAGLVLVTSDALTFRRAATPANVDLLSVQATDALSATVTAADGRKFTTADGGLTWK